MTLLALFNKYTTTGIVLFMAIGIAACKKTEYDYQKRPYNSISSFKIAGYQTGDTLSAIIKADSILVYWNATAEMPERIQPVIGISQAASISPASGEAVAFNNNTVYLVTAEDGTTRSYTLVPVLREPIPIVTNLTATLTWNQTRRYFDITGQYFTIGGDPDKIKIHAQRLKDGFEFNLPIQPNLLTETSMRVDFPLFTAEQDTGYHKIWVKIGNEVSGSITRWIGIPPIGSVSMSYQIAVDQPEVKMGDEVLVNYTLPDIYKKFYAGKCSLVDINLKKGSTTVAKQISGITDTGSQIKFKLPELLKDFAGYNIISYRFYYLIKVNASGNENISYLQINTVNGNLIH